MKCPKCEANMFLVHIDQPLGQTLVLWVCPDCHHERPPRRHRRLKLQYLCAFCHKLYAHIQTSDHTPLAELICPKCAKEMHIELKTHPDEPENEDNSFSSC